jgi:hypothetical protein
MVVVRGDKTYFNLVVLATEGFVQRGRRPRGQCYQKASPKSSELVSYP